MKYKYLTNLIGLMRQAIDGYIVEHPEIWQPIIEQVTAELDPVVIRSIVIDYVNSSGIANPIGIGRIDFTSTTDPLGRIGASGYKDTYSIFSNKEPEELLGYFTVNNGRDSLIDSEGILRVENSTEINGNFDLKGVWAYLQVEEFNVTPSWLSLAVTDPLSAPAFEEGGIRFSEDLGHTFPHRLFYRKATDTWYVIQDGEEQQLLVGSNDLFDSGEDGVVYADNDDRELKKVEGQGLIYQDRRDNTISALDDEDHEDKFLSVKSDGSGIEYRPLNDVEVLNAIDGDFQDSSNWEAKTKQFLSVKEDGSGAEFRNLEKEETFTALETENIVEKVGWYIDEDEDVAYLEVVNDIKDEEDHTTVRTEIPYIEDMKDRVGELSDEVNEKVQAVLDALEALEESTGGNIATAVIQANQFTLTKVAETLESANDYTDDRLATVYSPVHYKSQLAYSAETAQQLTDLAALISPSNGDKVLITSTGEIGTYDDQIPGWDIPSPSVFTAGDYYYIEEALNRGVLDPNASLIYNGTSWDLSLNRFEQPDWNEIAGNLIPAGAVFFFPMTTPPTGYLACRGQAVSKTDYARLYNAIGDVYGSDVDTFNLPDLQNRFIRGWGIYSGNGQNTGGANAIGVPQEDAIRNIYGTFSAPRGGGGTGVFRSLEVVNEMKGTGHTDMSKVEFNLYQYPSYADHVAGEIRPKNISLLACIKY